MRGLIIAAAACVAMSAAASADPLKLTPAAMDRVAAGALGIGSFPLDAFIVSYSLEASVVKAATATLSPGFTTISVAPTLLCGCIQN